MKARLPKGMGGGPQNMNAMIKQAQKMQEDMEALQAELDEREYDISAGGGMVSLKINGKKEKLRCDYPNLSKNCKTRRTKEKKKRFYLYSRTVENGR